MDMSEGSYGVSLLNDCKYGHEAYDNVMRLTLLKGPIFPDPNADEETHFFTYSLYPHIGTWREAGTIQQALNLNYPCYTTPVAAPVEAKSWITCDSDHVTLEAVKCAEDSQHLIVRIAEQHNSRQPIQLSFDRPISKAWSTNLMETIESELPPAGSTLYVNIKPYEVVTLRIELAK